MFSSCNKVLHRDCVPQSRACQTQSAASSTPLPLALNSPAIATARAKQNYNGANNEAHLPFKKGNIIEVTRKVSVVLWEGRLGHNVGFFPAQYVEEIGPSNLDEHLWFAGN